MGFNDTKIIVSALYLVSILLAACGGGGGGTVPAGGGTTSYTVSGTVSGLVGSVVLRENISDNDLTVTTNSTYTFTVQVASGSTYAYNITVLTQPAGQTCTISGGGIVSGNVNNVDVACTDNPYTVGGNVTGLTSTVVLQNNNGDDRNILADGIFTFATKVADGSLYKVTVLSQPTSPPQICSVSSGAGTVSANVTNVLVFCSANSYTVGGTVSGLNGSAVLQINDGDDRTVTNGNFTFLTPVAEGSPYNVTLLSLQFPNQTCSITGGSGTIAAAVTVAVDCVKNIIPRFAYVANNGSGTVSAYTIDNSGTLTSGALTGVGTVAAGANPYSVTVDPSGKFAYVANNGSDDVSAYTIDDTGALTPIGTVVTGTNPVSVTVDPTGKFAYVANDGSDDVSAYTIDSTTGALTRILCGGVVGCNVNNFLAGTGPGSVTIDPSGQFAYVANFNSNDVSAYTITSTGALTPITCSGATCSGNKFPAGTGSASVTVDPSGKFAYVANWGSDDVSAYSIDTIGGTGALTQVPCGGVPLICNGDNFKAGSLPNSVTVDPSGKFAYVANWSSGPGTISAYAIDGTTGALIEILNSPFGAGTGPFSVTVDPSGKFAYVANQLSADISAYTIDPGTGTLTPITCSGTCSGINFPAGTGPISVTTTIH